MDFLWKCSPKKPKLEPPAAYIWPRSESVSFSDLCMTFYLLMRTGWSHSVMIDKSVLISCKATLMQGRYTWRNNQVLKELAEYIQFNANMGKRRHPESENDFHSAGNGRTWPTTFCAGDANRVYRASQTIGSDLQTFRDVTFNRNYQQNRFEVRHRTLLLEGKRNPPEWTHWALRKSNRRDSCLQDRKHGDMARELREAVFRTDVFAV